MIEDVRPQHPEGLTKGGERLATQLFELGAIRFGNFRLKIHEQYPEAPFSPIYIDLRLLRRFPEVKLAAVNIYQEMLSPLKFDLLADVPTAATPLASSLSDRLGIGMITPRTDAKTHGSGTKVDGLLDSDRGKVAVLIDDLVTRADSKIEAVEVLSEQGIKVNDVVVLIDREQGGKEELAKAGLTLHAAIKMSSLLSFYVRIRRLSLGEYHDNVQRLQELDRWIKNS